MVSVMFHSCHAFAITSAGCGNVRAARLLTGVGQLPASEAA